MWRPLSPPHPPPPPPRNTHMHTHTHGTAALTSETIRKWKRISQTPNQRNDLNWLGWLAAGCWRKSMLKLTFQLYQSFAFHLTPDDTASTPIPIPRIIDSGSRFWFLCSKMSCGLIKVCGNPVNLWWTRRGHNFNQIPKVSGANLQPPPDRSHYKSGIVGYMHKMAVLVKQKVCNTASPVIAIVTRLRTWKSFYMEPIR